MKDQEPKPSSAPGPSRREFLQASGLAAMGAVLPPVASSQFDKMLRVGSTKRCIFLLLTGGPSQLDTFDMKPDAPSEIRGPYRPIRTNNRDIQISEIFPRIARHADKFSIVRTIHSDFGGVHDEGHQLIQTGRVFKNEAEQPHIGCVCGFLGGSENGVPPHVMLPGPLGITGGNMPHGQTAGMLGKTHDPFVPSNAPHAVPFELAGERDALRDAYGSNAFGANCLRARRLIERGTRFVTVNMFQTIFDEITWDIHGTAPFSPMESYRDVVGPMFDHAYSTLLEDLHQRGLLDSTLVVAAGEFGRTPKLNPAGGRDHWPHAWSVLLAGGGIQGGRVVGKTDAIGGYPVDRPVTPQELVATIYRQMGVDLESRLETQGNGMMPVVDPGTEPIHELI